jgi:serine/threonine protein kinase
VYRHEDSDKEFIAKKVRKTSDELEILTLFNNMEPKPDHIIPLIESFDGWVILPKMITVSGYIVSSPERLESKVVQVCLGLIEGVAFLHEWCVAHRDIKPDNLVLDRDFCLKIIDFDIAMRVREEDEEVDDQCGTEHWIAPEVEKEPSHSPMRADRWACGRVLLYLLARFRNGDERLKVFARNLCVDDPKERPSLREWKSFSVPDVRNTVSADSDSRKRKASTPRRDAIVVDGQTMSPNAKRLRLGVSNEKETIGLGIRVI